MHAVLFVSGRLKGRHGNLEAVVALLRMMKGWHWSDAGGEDLEARKPGSAHPRVGVFAIASQEEVEDLKRVCAWYGGLDVVAMLVDPSPGLLRKVHELGPRFVALDRIDYEALPAVVAKVAQRAIERECSHRDAAEKGERVDLQTRREIP